MTRERLIELSTWLAAMIVILIVLAAVFGW
jgi:hypothetical protein